MIRTRKNETAFYNRTTLSSSVKIFYGRSNWRCKIITLRKTRCASHLMCSALLLLPQAFKCSNQHYFCSCSNSCKLYLQLVQTAYAFSQAMLAQPLPPSHAKSLYEKDDDSAKISQKYCSGALFLSVAYQLFASKGM